MTNVCQRNFDADFVARALTRELDDLDAAAFEAHLSECARCTESVRARALVKATWKRDAERDEMYARSQSEQRIAARLVRRTRAVSPWMAAAIGAALGATVVVLFFMQHSRVELVTARGLSPAPLPQLVTPALPAPTDTNVATSPPPPAPQETRRLVVARACPGCTGHVAAGAALASAERIEVPRGATLLLSFAMLDGLLEDGAGIDVSGPAAVRASSGEPVVMLDAGSALVRAKSLARIRTEHSTVSGTDATWGIHVFNDHTEIDVSSGKVELGARTLHAGESVRVYSDGTIAAVTPPKTRLDAAPHPSTNPRLQERASFALAELDLARGAVDDARARLYPLMQASDPSLAGDATFLLARSLSAPHDRAELLARYLGRTPPSPYRQQAMLERAIALAAEGDITRARAIAEDLRNDPSLPGVVEPGLKQLETRLR